MGSSHLRAAEAVAQVDFCPPREHQTRAKVLRHPLLSPLRTEGRQVSAQILGRVLSEEQVAQKHIAQVLRVSPEIVQRWLDPACPKHMPVGDLVAVAIAGSTSFVMAYLDELARYLMARTRARRQPIEHALALAVATGRASSALTSDDAGRAETRRALRAVKLAVDEALADLAAVNP